MSELHFALYLSARLAEAVKAQNLGLEPDRLALQALANHLGTKLPEEPRVLLLEPWESPGESDSDSLIVPILRKGPLDQIIVTESLGTALLKLKHLQDAEKIENPAFWTGITSFIGGPAVAALTQRTEPLWVGGALFAVSAVTMLYANRWRDETALPDNILEFMPPIVIKHPDEPYYQAA